MNSNPIVEREKQAEEEYRKQKAFRYPYQICCVYLPGDGHDFPIFHEVKKYCDENNLTFYAREYDCQKYVDDIAVKKVLAFHILYKGYAQETHYFDNDPIHKIQLFIWAYQDVEREKARVRQKRREQWDRFKESFSEIFTMDHFRRKPALDLEASQSRSRSEVRETSEKKNSPKDGDVRSTP